MRRSETSGEPNTVWLILVHPEVVRCDPEQRKCHHDRMQETWVYEASNSQAVPWNTNSELIDAYRTEDIKGSGGSERSLQSTEKTHRWWTGLGMRAPDQNHGLQ